MRRLYLHEVRVGKVQGEAVRVYKPGQDFRYKEKKIVKNGEWLYTLWRVAMADQGLETGSWYSLDSEEMNAWDSFANALEKEYVA